VPSPVRAGYVDARTSSFGVCMQPWFHNEDRATSKTARTAPVTGASGGVGTMIEERHMQ